jgi:competence protein ComEA
MTAGKLLSGWLLIVILLAVIAAGAIVIWSRYSQGQKVEITVPPDPELEGGIYVGGEVKNPGLYPLESGEGVGEVIRAAGGTNGHADLAHLKLYVPALVEEEAPQKVNINHAEAWLLEALPGIGETRAQAILDYRQKNGPFRDINELVKVEGIGEDTFENIKHLLTVGD